MSRILPKSLENLIDALGSLPGVGPRSAERYAYYLLKREPSVAKKLARSLESLHEGIKQCPVTFAFIETNEELSRLYTDPERDRQVVAVVADPFDIVAIEKTNLFKGTYHVLGGLVSPIDNIGPDQLKVAELIKRIDDDDVTEIILATNASVEGESTALYLQQQIGSRNVSISRLASGLSVGVDLEYADQITLGRALVGRTKLP